MPTYEGATRNKYVGLHPTDTPTRIYFAYAMSPDDGATWIKSSVLRAGNAKIIGQYGDNVVAMHIGGQTLYRSTDKGQSFSVWHSTPSLVMSFNASAVDTTSGKVWTWRDGDISTFSAGVWAKKGAAAQYQAEMGVTSTPMAIAIDPNDGDVVWVSWELAGGPQVYVTTDGGTTWQDATGNLQRTGRWNVAVNKHTSDVFAGNDTGVWLRIVPGSTPAATYTDDDIIWDYGDF